MELQDGDGCAFTLLFCKAIIAFALRATCFSNDGLCSNDSTAKLDFCASHFGCTNSDNKHALGGMDRARVAVFAAPLQVWHAPLFFTQLWRRL